MIDRIIAAVALALLEWTMRRLERRDIAEDAHVDIDGMRRAGARVREWLRETDGVRDGRRAS